MRSRVTLDAFLAGTDAAATRPERTRSPHRSAGAPHARPGPDQPRPAEQVGDDHQACHDDHTVRVHGRAPAHLAVLDHVGTCRAAHHAEPSALSLLTLGIVTLASAAYAANGRRRDHRQALTLVGLAEHPLDRDRVRYRLECLNDLHLPPP